MSTSNATLQLPTVPPDFNGGKGVEFAQALFNLLSSTRIAGLAAEEAASMDFAALQQKITDLQDQLDLSTRKFRHIVMTGVTNAEMYVSFPDIGTTQYGAWAVPVIAQGEDPASNVVAYVIEGSKENNQCKFRIEGPGASYKLEFFFLEYKDA
jgi:hypothetical protein